MIANRTTLQYNRAKDKDIANYGHYTAFNNENNQYCIVSDITNVKQFKREN